MAATGTSLSVDRTRLPGVDLLRGIAVLLVVLHHINLRFQLNHFDVRELLPKALARVLFWSGYYSVIVFFVISGFLITSLSLRRFGGLELLRLREFYLLRVARIVPCLLLLLAVLALLHSAGFADYWIDPQRVSLGRVLLAAIGLHINWLEGHYGYLPGNWDVLWSLSIEETFYLLFPLLCVFVRSRLLLVVCLVALIAVGPFNRSFLDGLEPWDDYAYLSCMDGIAFGCLAALLAPRLTGKQGLLRGLLGAGVALSLLIIVFRQTASALGLPTVGLNVTLLELGSALMLVALGNGVGNSALSTGTGPLRHIGRNSYEIYLSHMFVVFAAMRLFKAGEFGPAAIPVWYIVMLVGSVLVGALIARYYSEPSNRVLRQWWIESQPRALVGAQPVGDHAM